MRYETTLLLTGRNTGIPVPPEVLDALGGGKRPAVSVVVNGYRFASTVGSMGGQSLIPFSAAHRAASGLAGGEDLVVELELDTAPRVVETPADLVAALSAAEATEAWERLPPSHRRAHATAVEEAKTAETRQRRVAAAVAKILG